VLPGRDGEEGKQRHEQNARQPGMMSAEASHTTEEASQVLSRDLAASSVHVDTGNAALPGSFPSSQSARAGGSANQMAASRSCQPAASHVAAPAEPMLSVKTNIAAKPAAMGNPWGDDDDDAAWDADVAQLLESAAALRPAAAPSDQAVRCAGPSGRRTAALASAPAGFAASLGMCPEPAGQAWAGQPRAALSEPCLRARIAPLGAVSRAKGSQPQCRPTAPHLPKVNYLSNVSFITCQHDKSHLRSLLLSGVPGFMPFAIDFSA
jgi:hypothetical protein